MGVTCENRGGGVWGFIGTGVESTCGVMASIVEGVARQQEGCGRV